MFNSINDLWYDALSQLSVAPVVESRVEECREIIGKQFILYNVHSNFLTNPIRKLSPWYAAAELLWYFSGTNEIEMIKYYALQYEKFSDDGVTAWGAYGYRWHLSNGLGQLQKVIEELRKNSNSRRAVMTCYDADRDLGYNSKDIPCTISLQFLIRNNKLNCICTMRSNDVWLGMPYDIWCFTCIQILIAQELGIETGRYIHQPGSLHLYGRNYEKAGPALTFAHDIPPITFDWQIMTELSLEDQIILGLETEKSNRKGSGIAVGKGRWLLNQCALWCGIKDHKEWIEYVTNSRMQAYMKQIW